MRSLLLLLLLLGGLPAPNVRGGTGNVRPSLGVTGMLMLARGGILWKDGKRGSMPPGAADSDCCACARSAW